MNVKKICKIINIICISVIYFDIMTLFFMLKYI